jgi:phage terminase large subunit
MNLSPLEFSIMVLGHRPYEWQAECLEAVAMQDDGAQPLALVAANGSGKTANVIAPLVLWFLSKWPRGQVIITSGSFRQIEKQLWPAMRAHQAKFPTWDFLATEIRTPEGGFALGFSTDDAGKAEGWHPKTGRDTDPVFIIVDEAKTVGDEIFTAFDRCTRRFQVWASSPGEPRGQFYEAFHKRREHFHCVRAKSSDCPHIPQAKIDRDREHYGAESPIYLSMHMAEFCDAAGMVTLPPGKLRAALESPPAKDESGEVVAFCDFAAGRDENCLAIRRGNHARVVKAWQESDTVQAARQFIQLFKEHGLFPGQVYGDSDGLGTVFIDLMADEGWRINRFHGGQAAQRSNEYANLIGEVWHESSLAIIRGEIHLSGIDPLTFEQLTTRRAEWSATGKLRVESKDDMRAQGIQSPDRADALLACIAMGARRTGALGARQAAQLSSGGSTPGFGIGPLVW